MTTPAFKADLTHAREIAALVLARKLTLRQGCARIAEVSRELNGPEEIAEFELLYHELDGHEHLGFSADTIEPEILNACKKLLG